MREILFKGKRKDNGEWICGHLLWCVSGVARITPRHERIGRFHYDNNVVAHIAYEVDPETVRQFTGLYDSTKWEELSTEEQAEFLYPTYGGTRKKEDWKGKPIFEGDIVEYKEVIKFSDDEDLEEYGNQHPDDVVLVTKTVKWLDKAARFSPLPQRNDCEDCYYSSGSYGFKVIGNIHDSYELL